MREAQLNTIESGHASKRLRVIIDGCIKLSQGLIALTPVIKSGGMLGHLLHELGKALRSWFVLAAVKFIASIGVQSMTRVLRATRATEERASQKTSEFANSL